MSSFYFKGDESKMIKKDCLFCKIGQGIIPSSKIYEDDGVIAFLDISQTTVGHALVIPKAHYDNFLAVDHDIMHKVMDVAQRIGQAEMMLFGASGINILTNVGEAAGQSVPHFHVHVIPRYLGKDPGFQIEMRPQDTSNMNLPLLAEEIAKKLK